VSKPDEALKALQSLRRQLKRYLTIMRINEPPEARPWNDGFYEGIKEAISVTDEAIQKRQPRRPNAKPKTRKRRC
jgi:hypothetical protein